MYAVNRLGSYITRGVSTVSGPFHPFGGAVDIIVVEQPDGSFKSSPWYICFGKFQGMLKAKEKIVNICVNGVEADFHMYLDQRGEAYFLQEVEEEDEDLVSFPSSSSSGDDTDGQSWAKKRPMKSKICNYDARGPNSIDLSNQKAVARTNSRRSRIFRLVFGQRSMKADGYMDEDGDPGMERVDSLERAEIAADLLDMKWSTNLSTKNYRKDAASRFHTNVVLDNKSDEVLQIEDKNGGAENSLNSGLSCEGTESGHQDQSVEKVEHCVSNGGKELPRVSTSEQFFEISTVRDNVLEEKSDIIVEETRQYVHSVDTANKTVNAEVVIAEIAGPVSEISSSLDNEELKKYDEWDFTEKNVDFLENDILDPNRAADKVESCAYGVTSETFDSVLHESTGHSNKDVYLARGEAGDVSIQSIEAKTVILHEQDIITEFQAEDAGLDKKQMHSQQIFTSSCLIDECIKLQVEEPILAAASFDKIAEAEPTCGEDIRSMISVAEKNHLSHGDKRYRDNSGSELKLNLESSGNVANCHGDCLVSKTTFSPTSESSEEEQFPFSDLDGFNVNEVPCVDAVSPEPMIEESHLLLGMKCSGVTGLSDGHEKSCTSSDFEDQENSSIDPDNTIEKSNIVSSPINISRSHSIDGDEGMWLVESMPNMRSHVENLGSCVIHVPLGRSLDSNYESLEFSIPSKEDARCSKVYACKEDQLAQDQPNAEDIQGLGGTENFPFDPAVASDLVGMASFGTKRIFKPKGMTATDEDERTLDGDASEAKIPAAGSWRIWPFSFKNFKSRKAMYSDRSFGAESVSEIANSPNADKLLPKPKVAKKMARAMTPTSEQLATLNLKEGSNLVTFTFSTAMLGKQQVDARIYLWKWNTRIIISDVDGTITKSDVLGQFMPLVGVDWSQSGVAHLFSAIKENGYQLLFLSARAISQAYHTRRFLFNLKQDGKTLPDGPVVISPDGLFPSLFREVIRRVPHEFKIACLEDIRALFPPDYNPFYAGFGNRITDEISYLKVGIPKGKVFTINPKGEVAVNKHVDTKSYTSIQALVHGMFPPMASVGQEDFNSWNFWKLPPATIDI